jgi:HlyD family secretion protein
MAMILPTPRPARVLLSLIAGLLVGVVLGGLGMWYFLPTPDSTSNGGTSATAAGRRKAIPALGRLEPVGGVLSIYGQPGDRILKFENHADQIGTEVKVGELLVEMAGDKLRKNEVALAERQLQDAKDQLVAVKEAAAAKKLEATKELENLERTRSAELGAQRSKLEIARLQVQQGEMQLARVRGLTAGSIARADLEQQELLVRKGQAELKAGEESLQAAERAFEDSKKLADVKRKAADAEEKRAIQAVPIDALTIGVESAREKEKLGRIVAPVDGTVVRVQTVVGEMTTQVKPILQLAVRGDLVVRAEIPDAEVERVRKILGKGDPIKAEITSRSLKELKLEGELSRPEQLAQAISRNTVVGLSPENESDRRVIEATIVVLQGNPEMLRLARSVLGLQVEVKLKMPDVNEP